MSRNEHEPLEDYIRRVGKEASKALREFGQALAEADERTKQHDREFWAAWRERRNDAD